ncbi:ArgE/DapE family deacylase [Aerococcus viridans]|uniref:Probable succinyl-diaminopimelate desuccinylase n=2 Tax=Aerococcus viridans TaxID=1377 RepID=A0AAU8UK36_9LACT|nr:ArgE/DapE family deacylase [Aerococcus viridans]AMC00626.1 succinyl-diaminopimelate desuccinylase [Aerococcus viridans]EFG50017.1 succinyl-diaminopimelate desuccinylase [Aerococcus viridans ATCC 11563 = CCUG 4311]
MFFLTKTAKVFTDEEKIKILSDIVAIETVDRNEEDVANYLAALLSEYGIDSKVIPTGIPGRANLVAEIGSGSPVLAISGHMDVVSAGNAEAWTSDPYTLTERDGKLFGRGSTDMKGGLAALVIAMIEIKEQGLLERGTLRLLATYNEENGAVGSIQLEEAGYVSDVDAIVIGEPTTGMIHPSHKGSMNFVVSSRGKSVHSSRPRGGINAIDPLMDFALAFKQAFKEATKDISFGQLDFSPVLNLYGAVEGDDAGNQELDQLLKQPTFNVTVFRGGDQVNTIPDHAEVVFNIRTVPEFDNEAVKGVFSEVYQEYLDKGADFDLQLTLDLKPLNGGVDSDLVQLTKTLGATYLNQDLEVVPMTGGTDGANFVANKPAGYPIIIFGPGSTTSHQIDEYVDKDEYLTFVNLYIDLLATYLENK